MDVHKDSITIAVLPAGAKAPTPLERLPNDLPKLKKWLARVARDGDIRACYEASGAGYVLHRVLEEWGYACEVIAPSLIPKRPGVQRKHDKRDAVQTSVDLKRRQQGQPPAVITHAWQAQQRLHQRYTHLSDRQRPQIAVVAVARELVGFLWAVMRDLEVTAA